MSYNQNSFKGVIWGIIYGTTTGDIKGDTTSLDYSSYIANITPLCPKLSSKPEEREETWDLEPGGHHQMTSSQELGKTLLGRPLKYLNNIVIMEKKMETTIGFRA